MPYTSPDVVKSGGTTTQTNAKLKTPQTIAQRSDVKNDASSRDASDRQLAATKAAANNDHEAASARLRKAPPDQLR
jgi:hypothetical protein